jgi:hypothetical protein
LWRPHRLARETLAAFLGSAFLGEPHLADWMFDAAQAFLGLAVSRIFSGRLRQRSPQYALNGRGFCEGWRRLLRVYMVLGEAGAPATTGAAPTLMFKHKPRKLSKAE